MTLKPPEHYARELFIMADAMKESAEERDGFDEEFVDDVASVMADIDELIDRAEEVADD